MHCSDNTESPNTAGRKTSSAEDVTVSLQKFREQNLKVGVTIDCHKSYIVQVANLNRDMPISDK